LGNIVPTELFLGKRDNDFLIALHRVETRC